MTDIAVIGVFATVTSDNNKKALSSFVAICLAIFRKSDYNRIPKYEGRKGTNLIMAVNNWTSVWERERVHSCGGDLGYFNKECMEV